MKLLTAALLFVGACSHHHPSKHHHHPKEDKPVKHEKAKYQLNHGGTDYFFATKKEQDDFLSGIEKEKANKALPVIKKK